MKAVVHFALAIVGSLFIVLGTVDRNYQELAIAGSVLVGSVVVAQRPKLFS